MVLFNEIIFLNLSFCSLCYSLHPLFEYMDSVSGHWSRVNCTHSLTDHACISKPNLTLWEWSAIGNLCSLVPSPPSQCEWLRCHGRFLLAIKDVWPWSLPHKPCAWEKSICDRQLSLQYLLDRNDLLLVSFMGFQRRLLQNSEACVQHSSKMVLPVLCLLK